MVKMQNYLNVQKIIYYFIQHIKIAKASHFIYIHVQNAKNKYAFIVQNLLRKMIIIKALVCLKRRMKYLFLYDGYGYINPIKNNCLNEYKKAFKYFITPIISFLLFSGTFQRILFEDLAFKNGKINNGIFETYLEHIEKFKYVRPLPLIINDLTLIILVIPFFIIHIYFKFFILIISIPFKLIPLKYILGLFYANISL